MRIKSSINNIIFNFGGNIINSLLGFISRTVFIYVLGNAYLGVNGLISNILSMLSLTELGVGTAITFSLYKPIAENNENKIAGIMEFYKKVYRYIGIFIFIIGLIIMPFLKYIIKDYNIIKENINIIYFLYLINTMYTYLFTYKRTLIVADQKAYKIVPFTTIFRVMTILSQIVILITTRNFIAYLIVQIITTLIENICINGYIDKNYPVLKKCNEKIDNSELKVISKNIKAMMLHKIGDFCINSTDNIIISAFVNIVAVGIYSNYLMLIGMINQFVMIFFNSLTASLGNLIAKESKEKSFEIFNIMNFIGFWIYGFVAVCFYNLINPFITLWIGKENLLDEKIVVVIIINYFLTGMRVPVATIKSAAGLYSDDKYVPIIQSLINLVFSIILVQKWGLIGVFVGTLISSISLPCWYRPILIYKKIFKKSYIGYFINYVKYICILILNIFISKSLIRVISFELNWFIFSIMIIICLLIPNVTIILFYKKTKEFKYILDIVKRSIKWTRK